MRRFDDERGVALITAILVTMIVALFAVTVVRGMESLVRLTLGTTGGLGIAAAIYSNADMTDNNSFTVGQNGNDGNIYVKGNWTCTGGANVAGYVYVQGTITSSGTCTTTSD